MTTKKPLSTNHLTIQQLDSSAIKPFINAAISTSAHEPISTLISRIIIFAYYG
jgi:hypothetical protein